MTYKEAVEALDLMITKPDPKPGDLVVIYSYGPKYYLIGDDDE